MGTVLLMGYITGLGAWGLYFLVRKYAFRKDGPGGFFKWLLHWRNLLGALGGPIGGTSYALLFQQSWYFNPVGPIEVGTTLGLILLGSPMRWVWRNKGHSLGKAVDFVRRFWGGLLLLLALMVLFAFVGLPVWLAVLVTVVYSQLRWVITDRAGMRNWYKMLPKRIKDRWQQRNQPTPPPVQAQPAPLPPTHPQVGSHPPAQPRINPAGRRRPRPPRPPRNPNP